MCVNVFDRFHSPDVSWTRRTVVISWRAALVILGVGSDGSGGTTPQFRPTPKNRVVHQKLSENSRPPPKLPTTSIIGRFAISHPHIPVSTPLFLSILWVLKGEAWEGSPFDKF
jgi:hypothetical protein